LGNFTHATPKPRGPAHLAGGVVGGVVVGVVGLGDAQGTGTIQVTGQDNNNATIHGESSVKEQFARLLLLSLEDQAGGLIESGQIRMYRAL
jgi:hypothetical protein